MLKKTQISISYVIMGTLFLFLRFKTKKHVFLNSTFIKTSAEQNLQEWIFINKIKKTGQKQSVIFSIGKEFYNQNEQNEKIDFFEIQKSIFDVKIVKKYSQKGRVFQEGIFYFYVLQNNGEKIVNLDQNDVFSFQSICEKNSSFYNYKSWDISNNIKNIPQNKHKLILENNICQEGQKNYLLFLQFTFQPQENYEINIKYSSNIKEFLKEEFLEEKKKNYNIEEILIQRYNENIQKKLKSQQNLQKCTVSAVSNLFGGLSFKYGQLKLLQINHNQIPKPIFSFTPSRQRFSWSFLWDDGFHNAIASKFEENISKEIIKSWLDTMTEDGWICREQTRGEEAEKLCNCPEFLWKDNRDGNPPSLILTIDFFIREHMDIIKELQNEGYVEKIEKWFQWYMRTQMINDIDIFEKKMKVSFSNGGTKMEVQNNLLIVVWMIIPETINIYLNISLQDILMLKVGCIILHISHFGYPNILPLALGLINQDTLELETIVQHIQNENVLWTKYGLRSLAKNDYFFEKGQNYWTGPIWIHINYLVLKEWIWDTFLSFYWLDIYYSFNKQ
ncbi:mannosyl-oligosaccharide glucosidase, putative [Ichthyophthirius multifiliis]|uniref:mannosyl-oligosaccharide glucosidase n=1 Tax=Ichthyophthirius multifiliis TaxID=5932 RepID=G0R2M3_ICHMU|nr:mannosyl-oligosaccharide glucosidase, putative [Ichthyophthirius multifiliis]EGR28287.1 mannosyl-oligosaccharide glucosidase, putative [Ichthyophthirius multifiliis]|eukprot:XP_004027632.1 mannosyl-oligosaccharide glucosidase, putative [Ichthyophthirius multifiliis]